MSKRKKHPGYKELARRYRAQAEHIASLHGHYHGRELVLARRDLEMDIAGTKLTDEAVALAEERMELNRRKAWGFWRRVRFAITGR